MRDTASAQRWIGDVLRLSIAHLEAPLWCRLVTAWTRADLEQVYELNEFFLASRETAELRAETLQMGYSLVRLFSDLGEFEPERIAQLASIKNITYPTAFTFAVASWEIPLQSALIAYLWSWLENQVMAAVKAIPLGQTDGQRMLASLGAELACIATQSAMEEGEIYNFVPGLAIASSQHETQYSRLFRS